MTISSYLSYKDSGIEWMPKVPEDWNVKPLFAIASERKESNKGMKESNLLSLSYGRIVPKDINSNEGLLPESFETYQIVHVDDMVFRLTDLQNDKRSLRSAIVKENGIITSAYTAVKPKHIQPKFLNNLLRAYDLQKVFYSMGDGLRQSMKFSDIKRLPIPLPPYDVQFKITKFLDRETTKLDTLIAKQEHLIELLQEKRQAIISHAVTKGLNPDAHLKNSGIEWIGMMPDHWRVLKIRRCLIEHKQGYYTTDSYTETGTKLLRITDLREYGEIDYSDSPYIEEKDDVINFLLKKSDFVFARTGGAGLFGVVKNIDHPVAFASYLIRFRFSSNIITDYFKYYFLSDSFQSGLKQNIHGGVTQNVHAEDIKNQYIAAPNLAEQSDIVMYLDKITSKIDVLISKAKRSIELAKEHRTALISAAVTGKIDVRDYVNELEAA